MRERSPRRHSTRADPYDVLVVGAGPAGSTAAAKLAISGCRVCLIEGARFPRSTVCAGRLSARAGPLLSDIGVPIQEVITHVFKRVAFYDSDLARTAQPNLADPAGYLVNRACFDHQLANAAVKAGARFDDDHRVVDIAIEERCVTLTLDDGDSVCGRLLIMAVGQGSPLMDRLGLDIDSHSGGSWAALVQTDHPGFRGDPSVFVVFGIDRTGGFGTVVVTEDCASVSIHSTGNKKDVVPHLVTLCRRGAQRGILNVDLSRQAAAADVKLNPTAVALAMDTHVAKRCLVVGDAGGFVAAASGEGIYPAMWSAQIACDVILKALDASSPQDALMEFDASWRMKMADHLRAPNTDSQYILPLIFSNQPMADRIGAAFFSGENL